jgi:hypothetical protein
MAGNAVGPVRRKFAPWNDPAAKPFIEFRGVTKRFGDFVAIDDLSLVIYEREFFALLGPFSRATHGLADDARQAPAARRHGGFAMARSHRQRARVPAPRANGALQRRHSRLCAAQARRAPHRASAHMHSGFGPRDVRRFSDQLSAWRARVRLPDSDPVNWHSGMNIQVRLPGHLP